MKSTGRHHKPVKNELAQWLGERLEEWKPHFPVIGVVAGVVVVGALLYLLVFSGEDMSSASAWQEYYAAYGEKENTEKALKNVAEKLKGKPAGRWATLAYADQELRQALQQLVQSPKEAKDKLENVQKTLGEIKEGTTDPALLARINMTLAKACETANKLDDARKYYAEVIKADGEGTFGKVAAKSLKRLEKGSDVPELVAWLSTQELESRPKSTANPFDFGPPEALPERPDLSIPGEMKLGGPSGPSPLGSSPLGTSPLGPSPFGPSPLDTKGTETLKSATPKTEIPKSGETKAPAVPTPVKPAVPKAVKPGEPKAEEKKDDQKAPDETKPAETKSEEKKADEK